MYIIAAMVEGHVRESRISHMQHSKPHHLRGAVVVPRQIAKAGSGVACIVRGGDKGILSYLH